jgi:hypothetical protein
VDACLQRMKLIWGALLGCALACSPGPTGVVVSQSVEVIVNAGPDRGSKPAGLDLDDPRIAAAERELTRLLGRPLAFELDPALLPSFDQTLQAAFVSALEQIVTQLQFLGAQYASTLEFAKAHLKTIRFAYAATEDPPKPELDVATGALTILIPSDQHALVVRGDIVGTLLAAVESDQVGRYDGVTADRVPAAEQRAYFDYQSHYHRPVVKAGVPKPSSTEQDLVALGNVLALYPRVQDPALQKDARAWLVAQGSMLRRAHTDRDIDAPAKRLVDELTPLWIRWLNQHRAELDVKESQEIGELMFEYSDGARSFRAGFDALGFAAPTLTAWAQRNPTANTADSSDRTEMLIVCPYALDRQYERLSAPRYCNGSLYVETFSGPGGPKRLAELLIPNKSDALTQTALLHVMDQLGVPAMLELFAALEADEPAARASLVALARYSGWGRGRSRPPSAVALDPQPLFARIPVWWKSYPARRAQVLYLLAALAGNYEGVIAWPKLASYLGGRISAAELSGFLDQSPRAVYLMQDLADALSDGWQKSAVLLPKLDAWLTNYSRQPGDGPAPYDMTERVVDLLCAAGTKSDLVELQTFLKKRVGSFPSERSTLGSFVEKPASELCPKLGAEKPTKRPVLFGD